MARKIFDGVAGNRPKLNRFDLSYTNTTSMSFGYLYPVQCDEVVPGDVWKMSAYCHAELMPLVAPVMSDIQLFAHTFFVPYRLIYGVDNEDGKSIWEKYITGGEDGMYDTPLPAWVPNWSVNGFSSKTIWDCIGNPVAHEVTGSGTELDPYVDTWTPLVPPSHVSGDLVHNTVYQGLDVCVAPKLSYNFIYNNFYRDEFRIDEVDLDNEYLLKAAFKKDYFTSALDDQQLGTAPALPVDVTFNVADNTVFGSLRSSIDISGSPTLVGGDYAEYSIDGNQIYVGPNADSTDVKWVQASAGINVGNGRPVLVDSSGLSATLSSSSVYTNGVYTNQVLNNGVSATTFTVSDLRLAFAIQRMQELTQRSGYRYTEWLSAHFNANPTDARLDRPEYIGGCVMNVAVSPLTQNSGTQDDDGTQLTPQGTKTGIGHIDSVQKIGNYRVLEHGLIMTIVSIRPKPIYSQGINRQWLRQSRFDHYMPETAWLSEMGIYNAEIYVNGQSGSGEDDDIFGYQAHWNEMRCKNNLVSGAVREQFNYWTLDRKFSSRPALNQDFLEIDDSDFNKVFAVQDEDPFVVSWSSIIDAYRPIPSMGVPGLIDHVYGGF